MHLSHFCSEWCIVEYGTGALWDLWDRSIPSVGTKWNRDPFHKQAVYSSSIFLTFHFALIQVLMQWLLQNFEHGTTRIDQSHRYGRHQAACREPARIYDKTTRTAICFEHKMQYLLIRAPCTRIVVFWHTSNIPPMISQSQISCYTPTFYIAAIFVKYCYTTDSWLL